MNDKAYKVYKIDDGIVIDHIPNKQALNVLKILGLDKEHDSLITMGINLTSDKMGRKDVIKIENKELSEHELNKIALVAPDASINIIKESKVVKKLNATLPDKITGIIKCPNPNCITRNERVTTIFYLHHNKLRCHYCERSFEKDHPQLV